MCQYSLPFGRSHLGPSPSLRRIRNGLCETIPEYTGGWEVTAKPDNLHWVVLDYLEVFGYYAVLKLNLCVPCSFHPREGALEP